MTEVPNDFISLGWQHCRAARKGGICEVCRLEHGFPRETKGEGKTADG